MHLLHHCSEKVFTFIYRYTDHATHIIRRNLKKNKSIQRNKVDNLETYMIEFSEKGLFQPSSVI